MPILRLESRDPSATFKFTTQKYYDVGPKLLKSEKEKEKALKTRCCFDDATKEINNIFNEYPELRDILQTKININLQEEITAEEFAFLWFGIEKNQIDLGTASHRKILNTIKNVFHNILTHIDYNTDNDFPKEDQPACYLSFSKRTTRNKNIIPSTLDEVTFPAEYFFEELQICGVKPYFIDIDNLKLQDIPKNIIDLFSKKSTGKILPDGPLALLRDFILFLDDPAWREINSIYRQNDKFIYNETIITVIKNFYKISGYKYDLSISDNSVCSNCPYCDGWYACNKANGTRPPLNQKEKALLQLCKPISWISRKKEPVTLNPREYKEEE